MKHSDTNRSRIAGSRIMSIFLILIFILSITSACVIPDQKDFLIIWISVSVAFCAYILMLKSESISLKTLLITGISIRVILLFAFPNLSDDIYRFYWDGLMWHNGENAYDILPADYVQISEDLSLNELYEKLNSGAYFTIYPPITQLIFYFSAFAGNVFTASLIMKAAILAGEIFGLFYLIKLCSFSGKELKNAMWYFLNPLVIIEGAGNLHFEVLMIAFFAAGLYYFFTKRYAVSGWWMAASVSVKLFPMIFFPYFFLKLKSKEKWIFFSVLLTALLFLFSPLWVNSDLSHYADSMELYFRKFEFNASIYFIFRSIGYIFSGYNLIGYIGPATALVVFIFVWIQAFKSKNKPIFDFWKFGLLVWFTYLLFSTTVHPWYLILLVFMSVFIRSYFVIIWSYTVFLSYAHYSCPDGMPVALLIVEYGLVLTAFMLQYTRFGNSISVILQKSILRVRNE
jgi:alpha-1,6-mannosyltransferase